MFESISSLTLLGIKVGVPIAAVLGSIMALVFKKDLTFATAVIALIVGFVTSIYLTPMVVTYFGFAVGIENGLAFLFGLIGMNLVTGFHTISERFSKNPIKTVKEIVKINKE